jgi:hypothetical protein
LLLLLAWQALAPCSAQLCRLLLLLLLVHSLVLPPQYHLLQWSQLLCLRLLLQLLLPQQQHSLVSAWVRLAQPVACTP